ncbi:MAG: site-specific integrase [candidate division NC10 bacterium]|nr:site-specific integrase [candidate division NC10 bacterium]
MQRSSKTRGIFFQHRPDGTVTAPPHVCKNVGCHGGPDGCKVCQRKETPCRFRACTLNGETRGEWWVRYCDQYGQLHREKVGPKGLAKEVYQKRKTAIREWRFFPEQLRKRSLLFDEAAKDWLAYAKANKRSYNMDVTRSRRLLLAFGGKPVETLTPQDVERFKANLKAEGWADATVNRHLALLKSMFNFAMRNGKIERSPAKAVKLFQENNARVRYLAEDEEHRLFEALPGELRPLVTAALHTGLRKGELLHLRWDDVDFHTGTLTVIRSKHGEVRRVPMNRVVKDTLLTMKREQKVLSQYVFCTPRGAFWHALSRHWYPALRRAALLDFRFHDLRHSFCSRLAMAGVDLLTIKELAGHKTMTMTLRYSHLSQSHQRQAVERLISGATDTRTDTAKKQAAPLAAALMS